MFTIITLFLGIVAVCHGKNIQAEPVQQVYCGEPPHNMFNCLKSPVILKRANDAACPRVDNLCERMSCIFRNSGWLDDKGVVNKADIRRFFDEFASANAAWSPAVNHLKMYCLGERELPAQGIHLNCPAYDIFHCIQYSFIKNAPSSQFLSSKECDYARSYAANCPVCPTDCFVPQVPIGSCNACATLPRTP